MLMEIRDKATVMKACVSALQGDRIDRFTAITPSPSATKGKLPNTNLAMRSSHGIDLSRPLPLSEVKRFETQTATVRRGKLTFPGHVESTRDIAIRQHLAEINLRLARD